MFLNIPRGYNNKGHHHKTLTVALKQKKADGEKNTLWV